MTDQEPAPKEKGGYTGPTLSTADKAHAPFSPSRVWALTMHTFTQMVRMRVFYFLLFFSAAIILVAFMFLRFTPEQELKLLKDVSLGAMSLFAGIFAIAGTALLIPKDLEDRTLYTILCKPVPRFEYLLGKLMGMLVLIFVSMLFMDVLFCSVVAVRQNILEKEVAQGYDAELKKFPERAQSEGWNAQREEALAAVREFGLRWDLQAAVFAIFLKASVMTAVTLLVSTFATTTLFTIISSIAVFIIGHGQHLGRSYFLSGAPEGGFERALAGAIAVIFPDFHLFDIVDAVVSGEPVASMLLLQMTGMTCLYLLIYTAAASFVFSNKEL
ncbi:MAG: ABC-type Na+ efflux pump permease subunit [Verrucomicrobiales bacterium]|jgi:ABC-type Na+ efflux pump permease subunit